MNITNSTMGNVYSGFAMLMHMILIITLNTVSCQFNLIHSHLSTYFNRNKFSMHRNFDSA